MRQDTDDPRGVPLDEARGRLDAAAAALRAFLRGSEDVFLDAGRRVAGLEQQARTLIEGARTAGALRAGTEGVDPASALGREFARMHDHLRASRAVIAAGEEQLGALVAQIEVMLRTQSHFASIPPTLRMLGLNTRIENARSSTQYAGMETVALEVRRLGDVVEPRFRAVFAQATSLLETVHAALASAHDFLHGQEAACGDMLGEMQTALAALQAFGGAGAAIADRAADASQHVTGEVGALLVALQGHDATRQAVEHVVVDLEEAATGGGSAGVAEACRLAAAQVRGARERFVASLDGITSRLRALAATGGELSRETTRFVAADSGTSPAAAVRKGVDRATHCLLQHVAHETVTSDAMGEVVVTVDQMGRAVKDIQGIGAAVKIIALNALVETERAGESGRVLAVLAQGIGALAGEVVQRTGEVSRALETISTAAAHLRTAAAQQKATEGEAVAKELEHLSVRLSELQRGLEASVRSMHAGSGALGAEIEALGARVAEARDGAVRLERVEADLAALAAEEGGGEGEDRRAAAYARYTMESERAIHERVVQGSAGRAAATDAPPAEDAGADGLGANVELF